MRILVVDDAAFMRMMIKDILIKHTGQPIDKITHDTDRDFYLNPEQAAEYGIIDEVLNKPSDESDEKTKKEKK